MVLNNVQCQSKAEELIALIKSNFLNSDGLLAREYPPSNRTLYDNFDDLVPFFLYFGQTDFLLSQIKTIISRQQDLVSLCAERGVVVTRNIDEWFGGLFALWHTTKDEPTLSLLKNSVNFVSENLFVGSDFLSGAFLVETKKRSGFSDPWSAGILETFCEMRSLFPDLFERSKRVMRFWISHPYFQKYHLFPFRIFTNNIFSSLQEYVLSRRQTVPSIPPWYFAFTWRDNFKRPLILIKNLVKEALFYLQNCWCSQMMKSNSTPAFTLLEFYLATKDNYWLDNLLKWLDSAWKYFCDADGRVYMYFFPVTGKKIKPSVTAAFILSDVICDTIYFGNLDEKIKTDLLSKVKKILDHAWERRLENGLVPMFEGGTIAHTDNQIDFAVSLRKFGELTSDTSYQDRSRELTEKVFLIHYTPAGYLSFSGNTESKKIDPKYNALMLKGLINLITMNDKIYPNFYSLFKDR